MLPPTGTYTYRITDTGNIQRVCVAALDNNNKNGINRSFMRQMCYNFYFAFYFIIMITMMLKCTSLENCFITYADVTTGVCSCAEITILS